MHANSDPKFQFQSPNHSLNHNHSISMEVQKHGEEAAAAAAPAETESESDDAVMSSWITADEETAAELSKLLESLDPAPPPPPVKVRFVGNPYTPPVVICQTSAGYVTIDGNDESCGSSFSETESFMASTDLCGVMKFVAGGEEEEEEVRVGGGGGGEVDVECWSEFLMLDDDSDFGGGGGDATWMEVFGGDAVRI